MKLTGSPSPGTFLGSLMLSTSISIFRNTNLSSQPRAKAALLLKTGAWRGPGLPVSWDVRWEAPEMMAAARRKVEPNCRGLESQLRGCTDVTTHQGTFVSRVKIWGCDLSHLPQPLMVSYIFGFLACQTNEIWTFLLLCTFSECKWDAP